VTIGPALLNGEGHDLTVISVGLLFQILCLVFLTMVCFLFLCEGVQVIVDFGEFILHFIEQFYSFVAMVI
jgi:hypothetical protein